MDERDPTDIHRERMQCLDASASTVDVVIACNDTSADGIVALERNIPYIERLCDDAVAFDTFADVRRFREAAERARQVLAMYQKARLR